MALHVLDEANRCLGCKKPLCQQGCPIHTNIPEVIRLLKANQMDEAGRMLFENNPLTTVCALVCNHENQCEGHCVRNRMPSHDPVHFSIIEDYISTTYANKMTAGPAPKNGMKAAVVGSGPAGLTIAVLLARWGYDGPGTRRHSAPKSLAPACAAAMRAQASFSFSSFASEWLTGRAVSFSSGRASFRAPSRCR